MSDRNLHPVMQGVFAPHMPAVDAGDLALNVLLDLVGYVDRGDTDDLDFGRGLASTDIIDRARRLIAANPVRAGVREPEA